MIWLKPGAPAYQIYLPNQGSLGVRHLAASIDFARATLLCARNAYVYREHRTRSCLKSSSRENRLAKLTGTAPLTSCRLEGLRIALISGVAWSCLAGWAGSADAAARGMGAPYGWDECWDAPRPRCPPAKPRVPPT